jgi:hypothetical protein
MRLPALRTRWMSPGGANALTSPVAFTVAEDEARAERVGEVAISPQLDVVAEPGGLLMRVRMATQPREQRHVVDDCPLGLVQLEVLGDAQTQHARSQHMLHRLPQPEVRRQRQ